MKEVRIYQIVDEVSERVISSFIAPNSRFAVREFNRFLDDPKVKDSFDRADFSLVCSDPVNICDSLDDSVNMCDVHDDGSIYDINGFKVSGATV